MDGRGIFSSEDTLLMVEFQNIRFIELPGLAQLDSSLRLPEMIQCFPEDRFEGGVFIREISCNNGYGTTLCPGTTCVGNFIYTDDEGLPTGRTHLSIQNIDFDNQIVKFVWFEKLDGEEFFKIVGIMKEEE